MAVPKIVFSEIGASKSTEYSISGSTAFKDTEFSRSILISSLNFIFKFFVSLVAWLITIESIISSDVCSFFTL